MKIRKIIKKLKKEDMATIYLNNGTVIYLREMTVASRDMIGSRKMFHNGDWVLRDLYFTLVSNKETFLSPIVSYQVTRFGKQDEYCVPERYMNEFISMNGDVDEKRTFPSSIYDEDEERVVYVY